MSEEHQSILSLQKEEFAQIMLGTREPWEKRKGNSAIQVYIGT